MKISFCDLTHTGETVCANTFPLGAAMVAAYAKKQLCDAIDIEIFNYPGFVVFCSRLRQIPWVIIFILKLGHKKSRINVFLKHAEVQVGNNELVQAGAAGNILKLPFNPTLRKAFGFTGVELSV